MKSWVREEKTMVTLRIDDVRASFLRGFQSLSRVRLPLAANNFESVPSYKIRGWALFACLETSFRTSLNFLTFYLKESV